MTYAELLEKVHRVKMSIMAHPHCTPDSEFADMVSGLEEIERAIKSYMVIERKTICPNCGEECEPIPLRQMCDKCFCEL